MNGRLPRRACAAAREILGNRIANGCGTDFAQWPAEAYEAMIEAALDGFRDKLKALAEANDPPC